MHDRAKHIDIRGKITNLKNVDIVTNNNMHIQQHTVACIYSAGSPIFRSQKPKVLPINNKSEFKISIVISLFNRISFLERTLYSYSKQTMSKNDFEIVIIDDKSTEDILGLCQDFSKQYSLRFNYILVDQSKGAIPPRSFCQSLTNNIGIKKSRGSVIIITGPETLQKETNLEKSWTNVNEGYCVYGDIYRSSNKFVDIIIDNNKYKEMTFDEMFSLPGAKDCTAQLGGFWGYYIAIRKEHLMEIHGFDEEYMKGIAADDDNFAFRVDAFGVPLIRNNTILGIHQDHSREDKSDLHSIRKNDINLWNELRDHNIRLLNGWHKDRKYLANENIDWGSEQAIIGEVIL